MTNDLLQERIQHSGILWLTCPANYWDVMFHRKLVSEEVTVLNPWIYHRDGKKKKKKGPGTSVSAFWYSKCVLISTDHIKEGIEAVSPASWQSGQLQDGRSAELKGD